MILRARYVFPVSGPPLPNGTVIVHGDRISAVDPAGVRTPDVDLGNVALLPGLVNAHTHLDLSGARGRIPPTDPDHFTDWLLGVIAYRRGRTPDEVQADIRTGLAEALGYGTTLFGDIAAGGASWDAVSEAAVRAVVFYELIGLSKERRDEAIGAVGRWQQGKRDDLCRVGDSPHAPYSANMFFSLAGMTHPSTVHLAESPAERDLIGEGIGAFVPFLRRLGVWDESESFVSWRWWLKWSSADWLEEHFTGAEHPFPERKPVLFAHCNYLPTDTPFGRNQSIVYCPRTHAAFGHPPHPFRDFLARGVRVCLGTDSLASNPDLDPLAEARFVRSRHPDVPGDQLLRMVTLSGAEALGWADECGSLEPGKSADLVAVPLPDADAADPHDLLLGPGHADGPRRTLFRGAWRD